MACIMECKVIRADGSAVECGDKITDSHGEDDRFERIVQVPCDGKGLIETHSGIVCCPSVFGLAIVAIGQVVSTAGMHLHPQVIFQSIN